MAKGTKTGGRQIGIPNKATAEIRTLASAYSAEAISILVEIARNADSDTAKIAACRELLDRGHGKARQATDINGAISISHDQRVIEMERRLALRSATTTTALDVDES